VVGVDVDELGVEADGALEQGDQAPRVAASTGRG
jgi:hypothetical protein